MQLFLSAVSWMWMVQGSIVCDGTTYVILGVGLYGVVVVCPRPYVTGNLAAILADFCWSHSVQNIILILAH